MKEALKLALEALEGWGKGFPDNWGDLDTEAVTAIKEALASPIIESYLEKDNLEEDLYDLAIKADNGGQP